MPHSVEIEALLREAGWLRQLAARLVNDPSRADDLAQETWISALRRPPDARLSVRPWLARVARNLASNARREEARREAREGDRAREVEVREPVDLAQEAETQRLLAEAVTRLPRELGDVIVLRYFRGLDSSRVAAELGISASAVRTRTQRALEALRTLLDSRVEGGRSAWCALLLPLVRPTSEGPAIPAALPAAGGATPAWILTAVGTVTVAGILGWTVLSRAGRAPEGNTGPEPLSVRPAVAAGSAPTLGGGPREAAREAAVPGDASASLEEGPVAPQAEVALARSGGPGAEVSGLVRVDGRAPEWDLELTLEPAAPAPAPSESRSLPRFQRLTLTPDQRGAFRFVGLPPHWRGRLVASPERMASGAPGLDLDGPAAGVVLDLVSVPAVVGRVQPDFASTEPLEGRYELVVHRPPVGDEPTEDREQGTFRCRSDGAFRIPVLALDGRADVALRIEAPGLGYAEAATSGFDPLIGTDLGSLVLEPVRRVVLAVHAPDGAPVEGAFAQVEGAAWARAGEVAGPDGLAELDFAPTRAVSLRVRARDHAERSVLVPQGRERVEVVLEPLAVLDLRLHGGPGGRLRISAPAPAFLWDRDGSADGWDESSSLHVPVRPSVRRLVTEPDARWEYEFGPLRGTALHLAGLVPGVVLSLQWEDRDGQLLAAETLRVEPGRLERRLGDPARDAEAEPELPDAPLPRKRSP